jgi:hypothetical protein
MSGADQIGMEAVMAVLTVEEQALVGAILGAGMSTPRTGLATIVRIDLDGHALLQERFVGDHAVQLGKAPFGVDRIGLPLLFGRLLALAPPGPFAKRVPFCCRRLRSRA